MAFVGVAITKRMAFRDATQEFTNVYHYQWTGLDPGASLAESLIDRLVVIERPLHATVVSFVAARCWNAGGTIQENDMIVEKVLNVAGTAVLRNEMDRERAFLFRWRAGVDSLGRPVYLRKYYHTCSHLNLTGLNSPAINENTTGIPQAARDQAEALVADLDPISFNNGSTVGRLISPTGRGVTGELECHKYLEHHQLGDQWRG